ncbi:MAG TPA: hypothetical protein VMA77_20315 [Solirubrobacteraceae bacterium]|nr:hypothetical protein [Solirubrobacteraceae bacterium]
MASATWRDLPLQYAGLVFACAMWASGDVSVVDKVGLALTEAMVSGIGGAERVRPLLRGAQPRPPRPRGDARGSGERADGGANPTRRFQALRHFDGAPQLPTGSPPG